VVSPHRSPHRGLGIRTPATTVALCTSRPAHRACTTSIAATFPEGAGRLSAKNFLIRDHSVKLCRHDGVPRTPRVRFRVGLVAPVTHATFGSSEHEHTSFRGTGSGASHMMGSAETLVFVTPLARARSYSAS